MAIKQVRTGPPGSEQGLGVDVGAQAGTRRYKLGDREKPDTSQNQPRSSTHPRGDANQPTSTDTETDESGGTAT